MTLTDDQCKCLPSPIESNFSTRCDIYELDLFEISREVKVKMGENLMVKTFKPSRWIYLLFFFAGYALSVLFIRALLRSRHGPNSRLPWPQRLKRRLARMMTVMFSDLLLVFTTIFRSMVSALCLARNNPHLAGLRTYKFIRDALSFCSKTRCIDFENFTAGMENSVEQTLSGQISRIKTVLLFFLLNFLTAFIVICDLTPFLSLKNTAIGIIVDDFPNENMSAACYEMGEVLVKVLSCDYSVTFGTMLVKLYIHLVPTVVLNYSRREKTYQFINYTSQLCRHLLPVRPWLIFWTNGFFLRSLPGRVWTLIVVGTYLFFKVTLEIKSSLVNWWEFAIKPLLPVVTISGSGVVCNPWGSLVVSRQDDCAICYDTVVNPKVLPCSHVYCRRCIETWFCQQRRTMTDTTCPMCTVIVIESTEYNDGSTVGWRIVV